MDSGEVLDGSLEDASVALFFTFGVSMTDWASTGILDREVALYNELGDACDRVYLFTYGVESDSSYSRALADEVEVVPMPPIVAKLPTVAGWVAYSVLCPFIHWRTLRDVDVVKTNQMLGSWTAVLASVLFRSNLVVRTGYVLSEFYAQMEKPLPIRVLATIVELVAYNAADYVVTSSPHSYEYVEERYAPPGVHVMIPNYIETDVFRPMHDVAGGASGDDSVGEICFVGRLAEQKNLFVLLDALVGVPCRLTLIGDGPLREPLESHATDVGVEVTFRGRLPNHDLPDELNRHDLFVLPSNYEGMPKSLLEAMSCGLPVIGTDVPGIADVLTHDVNGFLCENDVDALNDGISTLLGDEELRDRLGRAARREIEEHYSLRSVVDRELAIYEDLVVS